MGIRNTTIYNWEKVGTIDVSKFGLFTEETSYIAISKIMVDPNNDDIFYCCGTVVAYDASNHDWAIFKSIDKCKTWSIVDWFSGEYHPTTKDSYSPRYRHFAMARGIDIDHSGNIYVAGYGSYIVSASLQTQGIIRKSTTGLSGSFQTIDAFRSQDGHPTAGFFYNDIAVNRTSGSVYVCGNLPKEGYVRASFDGSSGSFITVSGTNYAFGETNGNCRKIAVAETNNQELLLLARTNSAEDSCLIYKSLLLLNATYTNAQRIHSGSPATFALSDTIGSLSNDYKNCYRLQIHVSGNVMNSYNLYNAGSNGDGFLSFSASNGASWIGLHSGSSASGREGLGLAITKNDHDNFPNVSNAYICGNAYPGASQQTFYIDRSDSTAIGGFSEIFNSKPEVNPRFAQDIVVDSKDNIYVCVAYGYTWGSGNDLMDSTAVWDGSPTFEFYKGKRTANSASIGPNTLKASFEYVESESSGSVLKRHKLANVSEFPHSSGIYQMPNVVIGTTDSGRMGNIESSENIITAKHKGSVVAILWPKQDLGIEQYVKGYGDFSLGQKPGKLTNEFQFGEYFDVTKENHDSLALYCYMKKELSGTQDTLQLKVERKPLHSLPFTSEQAIDRSISGSYAVAKLYDEVYEKDINYGDLAIREISWPIDIDLKNTKEIRISAKHKNGQSDDLNKNFVVWGRFIKSSKNSDET